MIRLAVLALAAILSASALAAPATAQIAVSTQPRAPTEEIHRDDLVADYFAADPATASRGAVIVLGGSEGGLSGSRRRSDVRPAHGGPDAGGACGEIWRPRAIPNRGREMGQRRNRRRPS